MKDLVKELVIHVGDESEAKSIEDTFAGAKKEAAEIAKLNRILYEAHLEAGFDEIDALDLTVAVITSK